MRGKRYRTVGRIPDHAILVRGGPLDPLGLLQQAVSAALHPRGGFYGLSVFTRIGATADEIFERSPLRRPLICETTPEPFRAEGIEVIWTDDFIEGHASLIFCREPTEIEIGRIMEILGDCRGVPTEGDEGHEDLG